MNHSTMIVPVRFLLKYFFFLDPYYLGDLYFIFLRCFFFPYKFKLDRNLFRPRLELASIKTYSPPMITSSARSKAILPLKLIPLEHNRFDPRLNIIIIIFPFSRGDPSRKQTKMERFFFIILIEKIALKLVSNQFYASQ